MSHYQGEGNKNRSEHFHGSHIDVPKQQVCLKTESLNNAIQEFSLARHHCIEAKKTSDQEDASKNTQSGKF